MGRDGDNTTGLPTLRAEGAGAKRRREQDWEVGGKRRRQDPEVDLARYVATPLRGPSTPRLPSLRHVSRRLRRRQEREVDLARNFATPPRIPSTTTRPPGLGYPYRGKRRLGIWLPAASPTGAALSISRPSNYFVANVLTVSIGDVVCVQYDSGEDDDDLGELNRPGGMQMGGELKIYDMENSNEGLNINVQDIDAYWLQRKIAQAYADIDPQQSQKLADEILKIIVEGDDRDVKNRVAMELDYEKFNLIKLVLKNRFNIVWCTRLARAEDQEERKKIEEEMMGNPSLVPILEQLRATGAPGAKRLLNNDSAGSDSLRDDRDMESGWLKGQRQLLELYNLSFHKGDLLMSNKKCEPPDRSCRIPHNGYEEVHVPALKPRPYATGE